MKKETDHKYLIWHKANVWPEGVTPHWSICGADTADQAFIKQLELRGSGEVIVTIRVEFEVKPL